MVERKVIKKRTRELASANEDLLSDSKKYHHAFQTSKAVILLIEPDTGKIADANEAACKFYGYSRSQMLSKTIYEINVLAPTEVSSAMDDVRKGKKEYFLFRHKVSSGDIRDVETYPSPVTIGAKIFICSIVHDVTDRVRTEALLRCRAELSDIARRSTMDELIQSGLDMAERLTSSKIGFFHFVDTDQENLTLQSWSTNTIKNMCKAEAKGAHYSISKAGVWVGSFYEKKPVVCNDYHGLTNKKGMPEGHALVTRFLSVPVINEGRVLAIMGVGNKENDYEQWDVEITEQVASMLYDLLGRKKVEEALAENERHYRLLVESSPFCIHEIGMDGRITSMNRAGLDMMGLEIEAQVIGFAYIGAVGERDKGRIGLLLDSAMHGVPSHFEFVSSSTPPRTFKSCFIPIKDAGGEVNKLMGITEDVSERKVWENNMVTAKKNAEEANILKDQFVSLVTHDLRTPLNGILGFLKMARLELPKEMDEDIKKMLEMAHSSGEQMAMLIDDILNSSRFRTGSIKTNFESFNVGLIGMDVVANFSYLAHVKGIALENHIPYDMLISTDRTLLDEVIKNLVSNAIKFCKKGDKIVISAESGEYITIKVSDTGPGIHPSLKSKILNHEDYHSSLGSEGEKGTGYGLRIVMEVVRALGGELDIESGLGKGAVFAVRLPSGH
jgi:PAS domain S-box-containing protein